MKVTYEANNSGGSWWLEDEDWIALEEAGWAVQWGPPHQDPPLTRREAEKKRWFGALAEVAHKDFPSLRDGIMEFESITGQDATAEGCNCCGPPHSFSCEVDDKEWGYSGHEVAEILYGEAPSYRELLRRAHGEVKK